MLLSSSTLAVEQHAKLWLAVNWQHPISDDKKWLSLLYTQLRFINQSHPLQMGLFEGALGYQLVDDKSLWMGYRWMGQQPYNNFFQENRLFQQMLWRINKDQITHIILRSRLEEIQRTNEAQLALRIRERLGLEINKPLIADWRPFIFNEMFIQVNNTNYTPHTLYGENRLFVGFNIYATATSWWEVGYMNQYQMSTPSYPKNQMSHILSITYNFDN